MKYTYLILIIFSLYSCSNNGVSFSITNESNKNIDSVLIGASENTQTIIRSLKNNKSYYGQIYLNNSFINDGSYFIKTYINEKIKQEKYFGYYTNGKPLNIHFDIVIKNDSIIIK